MGPPTPKPFNASPRTFSARSFGVICPCCERAFTFELGHLLDEGIEPETLRMVAERCPHCFAKCELRPSDVWELT